MTVCFEQTSLSYDSFMVCSLFKTKLPVTFHNDEPVVDDSQFKQCHTGHKDVVKVIEIIVVHVHSCVVILVELLYRCISELKMV